MSGAPGYARDMSKIEREIEQVTEGRDEATPFKALLGVAIIIAVVFIVIGLLIWLVVR
jgi:hypothetical protein